MKRRLAHLPLLLVLASIPSVRTGAAAQDDGGAEAKNASDDAKPADDAPDEAKPADENKNGGDEDKSMASITVVPSDGEKPVKPDAELAAAPKPKAHEKAPKAKRARAARAKNAAIKTSPAMKKVVALAPAPPAPPPAVPSTPVEPWNP